MKVLVSVSAGTQSVYGQKMLKKRKDRASYLRQQKLVKELREKFRSTRKNVVGTEREAAVTKANDALQRAIDTLAKMKATMKS
jgi:hypothetical protein